MNDDRRTIFITASRGFIVRNILRSGVLDILKKDGFRVVVFFNGATAEIPRYLREELEDGQVILENVFDAPRQAGYRRFAKLTSLLVFSKSTWYHSKMGSNLNRAFFWKYLELIFSIAVGKFHSLKTLARFLEKSVFVQNIYGAYFYKYNPSVVFSTSIVSGALDIEMMKEAERRGVRTVSMPKGWDNVAKTLYRFIPDVLIVQNEYMRAHAPFFQGIPEKKIIVTGFPQFDWYKRPEILQTREEYCASLGLDPKRKIIFFGSEGRWTPDDGALVSLIARWVMSDKFLAPCSLFVRPHFSDIKKGRFDAFKNISPNVAVDDSITVSDFFSDNWDPGVLETKKFTNLIYHCDIVVAIASTLTLDAVCLDKPIINVAFKALYHPKNGRDISRLLYSQDHYDWVLETGAVDLARSDEELFAAINTYLRDPSYKKKERKVLLDRLCFGNDGMSSERVAGVIKMMARGKQ